MIDNSNISFLEKGSRYCGQIGNSFLYWGLPTKSAEIQTTRTKKLIKLAKQILFYSNIILLVVILFISILTNLKATDGNLFAIFTGSTPLALLWWILLGILIFTSYINFYRQSAPRPTTNFGTTGGPEVIENYLDISLSFHGELIDAINKLYIEAEKVKSPPHLWMLMKILMDYDYFLWLIVKMEVSPRDLSEFITKLSDDISRDHQQYDLNPRIIDQVLVKAYLLASESGSSQVGFNHIFRAIVEIEPKILFIFTEQKISYEEIINIYNWQEIINAQVDRHNEFLRASRLKPGGHMNRAWTAVPTPILEHYGQDLTLLAKYDHLERMVGRAKEIDRTIDVLEKSSKNNVLYVGDAGVGKSTLVNGLAYRMVAEDVPDRLKDKRLISLNISQIFAGGSSGERYFLGALNEVIASGNIILFVDDLHLLAGIKTSSGGAMDVLSILTEMLGKYNIQFIASTTIEGNSKFISTYEQLNAMLSIIEIGEMDLMEAIEVIKTIAYRVENTQNVILTYPAVKSSVELTSDFIADKKLPGKALDILNEAAVVVKKNGRSIVTKSDIISLMQEKTKIPLEQVTGEESTRLLQLESKLHERVIGQDYAVKQVADAIKRARAGLKEKNKPIATFLFVGPTGVGKTELTKALAFEYFGDADNMVRLDMSEYQEKGDIRKIIGAPPGSSEFEERGYLTEAVKRNPFTVVLLDELEKAHPDILNLFLQVLDEGKIKDSLGRTVKFNNTIIIATSNAGAVLIQDSIKQNMSFNQIETLLMEELKKYYRPEFLNRFDGVIMFKPLEIPEIKQIAVIMIDKINQTLADKKINISVSDEALNKFIGEGYNAQFGARALYRTLQDKVKNLIAEKMLAGELKEGMQMEITGENEVKITG
jgi:ATP-dependent Clp protease ATP-binding subunit ClpA